MKKKVLVILLTAVLAMTMFTACGSNDKNIGLPVVDSLNNKPTMEESTQEKTVYKLSKVYREQYGKEYVDWQYDYDPNGNLTKKTRYYYNGEIESYYNYMYDSSGKLYKETGGGQMTMYEYDEAGNLIKESLYSGNGTKLRSVTEYESNGEKKLTTSYDIYESKKELIYTNYTYDSNHNLLMSYTQTEKGKHKETEQYEYDSKGNLIKKTITGTDLMLGGNYKYTYEYKYDESGKLIKEVYSEHSDGKYGGDSKTTYEYEYDSNGSLSKKTFKSNTVNSYERYEYKVFTEK